MGGRGAGAKEKRQRWLEVMLRTEKSLERRMQGGGGGGGLMLFHCWKSSGSFPLLPFRSLSCFVRGLIIAGGVPGTRCIRLQHVLAPRKCPF